MWYILCRGFVTTAAEGLGTDLVSSDCTAVNVNQYTGLHHYRSASAPPLVGEGGALEALPELKKKSVSA